MSNLSFYRKAVNLREHYLTQDPKFHNEAVIIISQLVGLACANNDQLSDEVTISTGFLEYSTLKEYFKRVLTDLGYTVDHIDDPHALSKTITCHLRE